jgi:S-adenosylmethionine hydrolase
MKLALATLTTDFGLRDPHVAMMKGVIYGVAPQARVVDISHEIAPQGVAEAAMALKQAVPFFPRHSLHAVVVDPGVGSQRDIVLVRTAEALFLAPDNGVLTYVLDGRKILSAQAVKNPHYFLPQVSQTFQGRDIFAPVIGHLLRGVNPHLFGPLVPGLQLLPSLPAYTLHEGTARGLVLSFDHFGNLQTNLPQGPFATHPISAVLVRGRIIPGVSSHYAAVAAGGLGAVWGSQGLLEIFQRNGSAQRLLEARVGDEVALSMAR